jgi:acetoin utilization deacetylase AcuC-like enzyme
MGGYCFLNNAAVAAQALRSQGCARVAVLDVDYHHGNGTQAIFYDRADVLFVSLHADPSYEYPFFSGYADETGAGAGLGCNRNLPLPAGCDAAAWFEALEAACSAIAGYGPDALVVSLGLDTYAGDPLTTFRLQSDDFRRLGTRIARLRLPTALILEGGYAAAELGINAARVLEGFENA